MIPVIGGLVLNLALGLAIVAICLHILYLRTGDGRLFLSGQRAALGVSLLSFFATFILVQLLINSNFDVDYIAHYTSQETPLIYKFTALWAGQSGFSFRRVENVGPKVSTELLRSGIIAIALSLAAMLFYIWIRFEWQFSIGAILALFHDVLLTLGCEWRWTRDKKTMWYPEAELIRQTEIFNWEEIYKRRKKI